MPYLKKIKIKGFKSFAPKTSTINLGKGFTVFTGPNGSGKSNILDAILFGLGELSTRRLRSDGLAKLMFDGGFGKASSAEVAIQFDNTDHRLPIDTNTVTISRKYTKAQSVYQLNGRRVTRSNIVDMLSMAGISSAGHNVVMQGTVTSIAEISPNERRRIIDDLIGIAQYDDEKTEAEEKLQKAEISIRTAMGRIEEVQKRVDDLERERNELIRYNFIQDEIKRLKAMKVSQQHFDVERRTKELSSKINELEGQVEQLSQQREELRSHRLEIEKKWRRFSSEAVDEGGVRILGVQIKIGDLKSMITELTTKIDVGASSLQGLNKVRENSLQQLEAIHNEIIESNREIRQLKNEYDRLNKDIRVKHRKHDVLSKEVVQTRADLGKNSKKVHEIERQLDVIYQKNVSLRGKYARSKAIINVLRRRLKDLETRRSNFGLTFKELEKSLTDLNEVKNEQEERFKTLQQSFDRRTVRKNTIEKEITEAGRVAQSAREAVVTFATQRELAENIAVEEKALRNIEELGNIGAIEGIYGRFRNLIKIRKNYKQVLEAAAAGWLDSIIVRDFDAAFSCAETLKRLKLGRIKIIPLREVSTAKPVEFSDMEGIIGTASNFVRYAKKYEPAIFFVFGDTLVAKDDRAALISSSRGNRTVTVNGDLFEAGGGIESGYFRSQIDFFSIIPSEPAVKSLDMAVEALQKHLKRRKDDLINIDEEIDKAQVETVRLSEAITTLESETARIRRNMKRVEKNLKRITYHVKRAQGRLNNDTTQLGVYRIQLTATQREIREKRKELAVLSQKIDPSKIQEEETKRETLENEIRDLRQMHGNIETKKSTLESKQKNVLKINSKNLEIQIKKTEQQLSTIKRDVEEALEKRERLETELRELEESKMELSRSVLDAKEEVKTITLQIDDIDKRLHVLDDEYNQSNGVLNELKISHQASKLQLEQFNSQLIELGYENPFEILPEQLVAAESALQLIQYELDRLGAVNQLAPSHYVDQISRYKELSIRKNELEREKRAILAFMDEIELKKRRVFMDAFNRINESFSIYFSKLTGGGEAALKLENIDDPFAGGMDIIVQFPAKPPIILSGASGGERSVAAVALILALQAFMPTAFYIFDEVDAHLDAFHVGKLGELLSEESSNSQFLVISLKPEMVSKAERVYGVYERNGVSNIVSTTFKGVV